MEANLAIFWSELHDIIMRGNNNCDTLVWDGDNFVQNTIGVFSGAGKAGKSHASLICRQPGFNRVVLAESNFGDKQMVYRSVTDKLIQQHGTAYWLPTTMSQTQRWDAMCIANDMVLTKTKYDTKGIFEYAGHVLFPWLIKAPKLHKGTAFCSAVVTYVYQEVGFVPPQTYAIAPNDIPGLLGINPVKIIFDREHFV